jgi:bifunctional non-homologous end joining protein LigD
MKPMLLTDVTDLEALLKSDEWIMEEKLDGDRAIVEKRGNVVTVTSREGNPIKPSESIVALAMLCDFDFVADGELMPGGEFVCFDLLEKDGSNRKWEPQALRSLRVARLSFKTPAVQAKYREKKGLLEEIRRNGGEGVVFKRAESEYIPGTRSSDWQRYKFYETETFTVGQVNIAKCSFEAIRDGKSWGYVPASISTLPLTGETVRIRFDKYTENGKLLRARLAK